MQHMTESVSCDAMQKALPWFITGRLAEGEAVELRAHLGVCETCRQELAAEEQLRSLIGVENSVELAPQASMRKFFERLDNLEAIPASAPTQTAPSRFRRWQVAAAVVVTVQAAGLTFLGVRLNATDPRTVTAAAYVTRSAGAEHTFGPRLRMVVDPSLSMAEFEKMLQSIDAQIISGPSEARVYTVALPAAVGSKDEAARLAVLRQNPAVRFAEPISAPDTRQ